MSPATSFSALALSTLALAGSPATAFISPSTFTPAGQVRHASPATRISADSGVITRMVAAPEKVATGVKRNENFAKLKV